MLEFAARPEEHIPASEIAEKYGESAHHPQGAVGAGARAHRRVGARRRRRLPLHRRNARRLTLLNVIVLFEDLAQELPAPPPQAGATHDALARVLGEIDQIAVATLGSVTIATLLKEVGRAAQG